MTTDRGRSRFWPVAVVVLTALVAARSWGQPRSVFIVNIDGLRATEGFEAGSRNLPFVWDSLRPLGTVYTNMYNRGVTVTNSAHSTIVTGARQLLWNNLDIVTRIRPREPTIGEYFRSQLGAPPEKAVFVSGKSSIWRYPIGTWPGFGYPCAPTLVYGGTDRATWDSVRTVIDRSHPTLCYIVFAEVDEAGHAGDTSYYLSSIRRADSLVCQLWHRLQIDTVYRERTALIVTDDHGRHDDEHGGWREHGCWCHGCRHVMFLALGPGVKTDTAVARERDQIDIAPTIGRLLGFSTPYAHGGVMTEMLTAEASTERQIPNPEPETAKGGLDEEMNLSNTSGQTRSCGMGMNRAGLHVVYADNSTGAYGIYYTRSLDRGNSWSTPVAILPPGTASSYSEPAIVAFGDSGLFVAAAGYERRPEDSTFVWVTTGIRSTNSGATWESRVAINTPGTMGGKPAVSVYRNRINVISMYYTGLVSNLSRTSGATFADTMTISSTALQHHPKHPTAAAIDTACYVLWQDLIGGSTSQHNIWFDHEPWHTNDTVITANFPWSYSYEPELASDDDGNLHAVYAHLPDAGGGNLWHIDYRRSTDRGRDWGSTTILSPGMVAHAPAIRTVGDSMVYCVWASWGTSSWSIKGTRSADCGVNWELPVDMSTQQALLAEPAFAVLDDTLFIVWPDYREGNWDIFFTRLAFPVTGVAEERQTPDAQRPTLSISPNPLRSGFAVLHLSPLVTRNSPLGVSFYDVSGRLVLQSTLDIGHSTFALDLRSLSSGVYMVRLSAGGLAATQKLVVQR